MTPKRTRAQLDAEFVKVRRDLRASGDLPLMLWFARRLRSPRVWVMGDHGMGDHKGSPLRAVWVASALGVVLTQVYQCKCQ